MTHLTVIQLTEKIIHNMKMKQLQEKEITNFTYAKSSATYIIL